MFYIEKQYEDVTEWLDVKTVVINTEYIRSNGFKSIVICKENEPYAIIKIFHPTFHPFFDSIVWGDYVCVGTGDDIYFIDLLRFEYTQFEVDTYFGYFLKYQNRLYAASGTRLYCFNNVSSLLWVSKGLAVDGIIFGHIENGIINLNCEMDPPGGWTTKNVCLDTGKEIVGIW